MKADLHLHSTASDGMLSPQEVTLRAAGLGFSVIALSDHDCVDGIHAAQETGAEAGVHVIPAVELSCGGDREIHILGYGFDPKDAVLIDFCAERARQRIGRTEKMVKRLCAIGKEISLERVHELSGGVMGRPHVARALVEAGHVRSVNEAFERFLIPGKPGYEPKEDVSVREAVELIMGAGGVAVLAHPMEMRRSEMVIEALVHEWKTQGLAGVEVWHPSAQNNHARFLLNLARREGLLVTGGSDFHGATMRNATIGDGIERWRSAEEDVSALLSRLSLTR